MTGPSVQEASAAAVVQLRRWLAVCGALALVALCLAIGALVLRCR